MWIIDQAKKVGIQFSDQLIDKRKYNVITDPIVQDSTGNAVTGDGVSSLAGPYFDPGRDFAWANSNNGSNRINQHLTGMNTEELSQHSIGYKDPKKRSTNRISGGPLGIKLEGNIGFSIRWSNEISTILKL